MIIVEGKINSFCWSAYYISKAYLVKLYYKASTVFKDRVILLIVLNLFYVVERNVLSILDQLCVTLHHVKIIK